MILYTESPIPVMMQNLILLDEPTTHGCIYVSKATYDQALLLWGRFDGDVNNLMRFTQRDSDAWKNVLWIQPAMRWIKEHAPEPLNMLAPTFKMLSNLTNLTDEDLNPKLIYGLLHILSQAMDFNLNYIASSEVRAQIKIPAAILMSYEKSWEGIISPLKENLLTQFVSELASAVDTGVDDDEEDDRPRRKKRKSSSKRRRRYEDEYEDEDEENEEEENDGEDEDEDENDIFADIFAEAAAEVDEQMKEDDKKSSAQSSDNSPTQSTTASIVAEESNTLDNKADEAVEANAVLDEYNF